MTRWVFVKRKALELYRAIDTIRFPIEPEQFLPFLPIQTKLMTYRAFADAAGASAEDVAQMCGSQDGATHYIEGNSKCLILYNNERSDGRIRWTVSHEMGHVLLGHMDVMAYLVRADSVTEEQRKTMEEEADYFTWNFLAPLPVMLEVGIQSPSDVRTYFGLSRRASEIQFERFVAWRKGHIKTAWENDILREYRKKT